MKTTEEKNRMIAEFMGCENTKDYFRVKEFSRILLHISELKYHTSWDWLMPVVQKIESIGYDFEIHREWATITDMTDRGNFRMIQVNELDKKSSTYNAVVEFIECYNNLVELEREIASDMDRDSDM